MALSLARRLHALQSECHYCLRYKRWYGDAAVVYHNVIRGAAYLELRRAGCSHFLLLNSQTLYLCCARTHGEAINILAIVYHYRFSVDLQSRRRYKFPPHNARNYWVWYTMCIVTRLVTGGWLHVYLCMHALRWCIASESPVIHVDKMTSMKYIFCLQISSIPLYYFARIPHVTNLDLSHNLITSINKSTFHGATDLEMIHLSHMPLTYIHPQALISLHRLRFLNVSHTCLTAVPYIYKPPPPSIITQAYHQTWKMRYAGKSTFLFGRISWHEQVSKLHSSRQTFHILPWIRNNFD